MTDENHKKDALKIMNFSSEEIQDIIEVVAAMLLMGNINFERDRATTGSGEKSKVQNRKILSSVARLLKIEESELEKSLTQRIVNAKGDSVKCTLNTDEAQQAQKSFVKVLLKKNSRGNFSNFWESKNFSKLNRITQLRGLENFYRGKLLSAT